MGDTGSLSLGGSLASIAIIAKHEIVLAIIGACLFLKQSQLSYKFYLQINWQRVFKMAPIHHHFEKKGWAGQLSL